MKRDDVLIILKSQQESLLEVYGVKFLYLFGSTARDEAGKDSDVDLLVEFERPIGLFKFVELQQRLEDLLGCKVDLGTKRSLKLQIKNEIIEGAIRVS